MYQGQGLLGENRPTESKVFVSENFTNVEQESSIKDYFNVMNEAGLLFTHPETYKADYDPGFDPRVNRKEELGKLTDEEYNAVIDSVSDQDFDNKLLRYQAYKESAELISKDGLGTQIVLGLTAGILAPSTFIPVVGAVNKANQLVKASTTLGRIAKTGAITGAVGATGAVASEAMFDAQGLPTDYVSAALFGAVLGGGIGGVFEGISRTAYKSKVAKLYTDKDDIQKMDEIPVEKEVVSGQEDFPERIKTIGNNKVTDFFTSDVLKAASSANGYIREFGSKLASPFINNSGRVTTFNASDDIARQNGLLNQRLMNMAMQHRDARVDGTFKGSFDDYMANVGRELQAAANKQELNVKQSNEYQAALKEYTRLRNKAKRDYSKKIKDFVTNTKNNAYDEIVIESPYKKGTPEYDEALLDYLTTPDKDFVELTPADLTTAQYPKGFGNPKPKWFGEPLEFLDNVTKSIYIAGSKSKAATKDSHIAWLKDSFGFTMNDINRIRKDLLADAKKKRSIRSIESYISGMDTKHLKKPKEEFVAPTEKIVKKKKRKLSEQEKESIKRAKEQYTLELEASRKKFKDARFKIEDNLYKKELDDIELSASAKEMSGYFKEMLTRGQKEQIPTLMNISTNRLYMPRQINYNKVREMSEDQLVDLVYTAMKNHPENKDIEGSLLKSAQEYASDIKDRGFDSKFNDFSVFASDTLGVDKHLQGRKVKLNTDYLQDILQTHAGDVMGGYHYWMRGQNAIRAAFPELRGVEVADTYNTFKEKYVSQLRATAKSEREFEEIAAIDRMFQDITGTLRMPSQGNSAGWMTARIATQANAMTLGGMMGLVQLLELPAALWATGFNRLFHKQFMPMLGDMLKASHTGTVDKTFYKEMIQMGHNSSLMELQGINRIAETETVFNMSKFEHGMNKLNHKLFTYNGMRGITAWLENIVASNAVVKIANSKLDAGDMHYFAKWGLDANDVKMLQAEMKQFGDIGKDGTVNKIGLENMSQAAKDKIGTAIHRAVASGVMQGDTMHLPNWLIIPTPFKKVVTQFMRFPFIANDILLRRGFNEDFAGWAATTMGSIAMGMGMFYLMEQAELASGVRDKWDAKYDITTEEGQLALVQKAVGYTASFGSFITSTDFVRTALGMPRFGRDYADNDTVASLGGVTAGRIADTSYIANQWIQGNFEDERAAKLFTNWHIPMQNFPILGKAFDNVIEEYTIKH